MTIVDFLLMMAVVAIIAWFATKRKRRHRITNEEQPLLPGASIDIASSNLFKIPKARKGASPFFLVIDLDTADILTDLSETPLVIAFSYILLDPDFELIERHTFYLDSVKEITSAARRIHRIDETVLHREGISPELAYRRFDEAFAKAHVIVAHSLGAYRNILDNDRRRLGFSPLPWENKKLFSTMDEGMIYLQRNIPNYSLDFISLRSLYGYLYFASSKIQFKTSHKSREEILLVVACLRYLYDTKEYPIETYSTMTE